MLTARRFAFAVVSVIALSFGFIAASPAHAAGLNQSCEQHEFCIYVNAGDWGASDSYQWTGDDADYTDNDYAQVPGHRCVLWCGINDTASAARNYGNRCNVVMYQDKNYFNQLGVMYRPGQTPQPDPTADQDLHHAPGFYLSYRTYPSKADYNIGDLISSHKWCAA